MNKDELSARTKQFALRVMRMTDALPSNTKGRVLGSQIICSATSAAAGCRAACRARSRPDWIDKIGRVLEEADESMLWVELIEEGGLLPAKKLSALKNEAAEITALFAAIHRTSKSKIQNPKSEILNPK
jgi:four helix bundle protein